MRLPSRRRVGVCVAVMAGCVAAVAAQNALSSLGVEEAQAKRDVVYALENGRVNVYPARAAFKAAAPAARAAFVTAAMTWAKAYTQSAAFKADYEKQRAQAAPKPPAARNADAELAKQKAERNKGLEEMKKNLDKMPPEMRAEMAKTIKQLEAQSASQDADPQFAAMMRQGAEMQVAGEQKQYQESLARHEKKFPANPNVLIAQRLREFLAVSKDVDFNAKLVPAGGKQRFENPAYEAKSSEWKLCYRAGKDAVEAGRTFAASWLASLEGK